MNTTKQTQIKVGDYVSFKSDIEQSAEVVEIKTERRMYGPATVYVVKAPADGFSGHYIGRADFAEIDADDCW